MAIRSEYRKAFLFAIASYKIVPATESAIELLVNANPELESVTSFKNAYVKLQKEPYKLVTKEAVFNCERNNRDAIRLTQKGRREVSQLGFDFDNQKSIEEKNISGGTRAQFQYRMNEALIFIIGSKALQEEGTSLAYYTRDDVFWYVKNNTGYEKSESALRAHQSSRLCGLLFNSDCEYAVYDIKKTNIEVFPRSELRFTKELAKLLNREPHNSYDKILLADSFDILNTTVLMKYTGNLEMDVVRSNGQQKMRKSFIFAKTDKQYEIENREKMYLLISKASQQVLVELFNWSESERWIRSYINQEFNREKNDERKRYYDESIGTPFGELCAYENDDEVGFSLVRQELNNIYATYLNLLRVNEGDRIETRHLKFYGINENREIYDKVFSQFENTEFVEIDTKNLLLYVRIMETGKI